GAFQVADLTKTAAGKPPLLVFSARFPRGRRIHLMNAPAFLRNYSQRLFQLPELIFGNISWRRPRWLSRIGNEWTRLESAHPRLIAPAIVVFFLVSCGTAWGWHWYQHRPKPYRVEVTIAPIPVTKLEKDLKFPPLVVYF